MLAGSVSLLMFSHNLISCWSGIPLGLVRWLATVVYNLTSLPAQSFTEQNARKSNKMRVAKIRLPKEPFWPPKENLDLHFPRCMIRATPSTKEAICRITCIRSRTQPKAGRR